MSVMIAFFAGMLTLLSPCTLPVIPLVFASVQGRKGPLLALLSGMVLMFTAVALLATVASQWIITITLAGRWAAILFFAASALMLLSERIANRVTQPLVALGNHINQLSSRQHGLVAALLAGLATGLLWSPCAGPILGAILSLAAVTNDPLAVSLLLIAYGSGAALMLALLWFAGRELVKRLRPGLRYMTRLRQLAGAVMLAAVVLIATGSASVLQTTPAWAATLEQHLSQWEATTKPAVSPQPVALAHPRSALPALDGGTAWLNGAPLTAEKLNGNVVLVDFWTFDCINCQHTLPHVRDWAKKYQSQGLVVVGVHTPEYPWERDEKAVSRAIRRWQLPYPVVTDNHYAIWNRFGNQYWPAFYLFDKQGQLRFSAFGEGNYAQYEQAIQQLLHEKGPGS